jgi:phage-related tail fiber protein
MATYNKFNAFVEHVFEKVHNLAADTLKLALTAAANAPVAGNSVLADLTEISYTNLSSRNLTVSSSSQTSGTYSLVVADLVLTASGGAVATFRYVVAYNDTPVSPADPLISWWDYGGNVTLADGETFTFDQGATFLTAA